MELKSKCPTGPIETRWEKYKFDLKLINPANKRKFSVIMVGSGLVMDMLIPNVAYERSTMQVTNMIHGTAGVLMMTLFLLHIYLGTIGMRGAYKGMRTGYVDEAWAREHHEYWYEDIKAGRIPAQRSQPVAIADDVETARPA